MDYEWDQDKAASNLEKHGVTFEEAATVDEHRYLIMGQSTAGLIVSYTERDDVVRLISAREVTSSERRAYEEG